MRGQAVILRGAVAAVAAVAATTVVVAMMNTMVVSVSGAGSGGCRKRTTGLTSLQEGMWGMLRGAQW